MARRISLRPAVALTAAAPLILLFSGGTASATAPAATSGAGDYVLTAHSFGGSYAPTYTGNGYLAIRVPAAGQGYAAGTVPAQAELAGFYAQPPGDVQQRANLPTWSTLTFSDGAATFAPGTGTLTNWRQSIDLHTGVITTSALWTAPNGHRTSLRYDVFTDRARPHVAAVRLQLTPQWTGTAAVTDLIDGTPATLTTGVGSGRNAAGKAIWESVRTVGTGITAALASRLQITGAAATVAAVANPGSQSIGQRASLPVTAGRTYTVTKYVGVTSSQDAAKPDRGGAAGGECGDGRRLLSTARGEHERVVAAVERARRRARQSDPRDRGEREPVLPLVEHARRGRTGASRPRACRPTATTATSSGTPRRGCTRRCWPSIRSSPRA